MENEKSKYIWVVGCGGLLAIVCTALIGLALWFIFIGLDGPSDQDIEDAMKQGDIILVALKEYHGENGSYPAVLKDLVPTLLSQIPSPTGNEDFWSYHLWPEDSQLHGGEFQLSHDYSGWLLAPNPVIYSKGNSWSIDTK